VRGSAFARTQEDGCGVGCGDEPEQRIHEVNPNGVFHADDATLFGCRVGFHEDLAKDAEECEPEDAAVDMSVKRFGVSRDESTYHKIQSQAKAQYDLKNGMP
jgi:hypothetical protein